MNLSLSLVLTSALVGAPGDCACTQAGPRVSSQVVSTPQYQSAGRMGILYRLRYGSATPSCSGCAYALAQPAQSAQMIRTAPVRLPSGAPQALPASPVSTTVTMYRPAPEQQPTLQVAKKYEDKVGHEEDYSWVTGHLFYVRADGGRWVVRYGLPDETDKFGGSIVLAPGVEMSNYREGDLVCVRGDVLDERRASPSLGGALYRVNTITIVDRSDP